MPAIPFLLALCCSPLLAQEPPSPETPPEEIRRLEEWPALDARARERVRLDIERLRKAHTPQMAEDARVQLLAAGAGAAPELLVLLARERDEGARERAEELLEALTGPEHTRLLAREFDHKAIEVRTWTLRRCGRLSDRGIAAPAEAALARARKPGEKADPDELYAAALCATAAGSTEGLDVLAGWVRRAWGKRGDELRAALGTVRGPEAVAAVRPLLEAGDRPSTVAGLNMLSACGDRASAGIVRPYLDSDDNSIRVAAINAMRGIVDGDPPLENLPVFEAIELAKKWKQRS